jgi:predicted RNA polymerase sigma factor
LRDDILTVVKKTPDDFSAAVLERLRPTLEAVLAAHRVPVEKAGEILEEACFTLAARHPRPEDPEGWLARDVIERCQRFREEGAVEDPSE